MEEWLVLSPEVEALCGWLPQGDPEGRTQPSPPLPCLPIASPLCHRQISMSNFPREEMTSHICRKLTSIKLSS